MRITGRSLSIAIACGVSVAFQLAPAANLIRGPYLQAATPTGVCVMAECDSTLPVTVEYGLTGAYGSSAQTVTSLVTTAGTYVHRVSILGLQPDTPYHYRLVASNTTSPDATFRTVGLPGTDFRFTWMADCRSGTGIHDAISLRMRAANPVLSLYGGDLCNTASYSDFTNEFFRTNELALDAMVPFYNAPGNHETWGQNTKAFTENPSTTSGTQDYYSFDCGDVHVLVINNQIADSPGSAQFSFATNDLATTRQPWKIVTSHEPAYCFGGHTPSADMRALVAGRGVDLVISGHAHYYERLFTNGIRQLVVGAAGAPLADVGTVGVDPGLEMAAKTNCYAVADVTYTSLCVSVYNEGGGIIDSLSLTKPAAPWQLAFAATPVGVHAGEMLTPAISVEIWDVKGNLLPSATNWVSIGISSNPSNGVLSGTLVRQAVNGVAVFDDLSIDKMGSSYRLAASATVLTPAISGSFNVLFADLNNNGIADSWEIDYFGGTNITNGAASSDWDADGKSNLSEFIAGTNPTNTSDQFTLNIISADGKAVVSFLARSAGANYYVGYDRHHSLETTTNTLTGSWFAVPGYEDVIGTDQIITFTNQLNEATSFFRGRVWLQPK